MPRVAILIGLAVLALGVGFAAFLIGKGSGPDLASSREDGQREGSRLGAKRGRATGYTVGYARGRKASYPRAYKKAYRAAYAKALEETPSNSSEPTKPADIVLDCPVTGAEPNLSDLSVRNMGCAEAVGVIGDFSSIYQSFSVRGFSCTRISGGELAGAWRCVQGTRAFRFDFAD